MTKVNVFLTRIDLPGQNDILLPEGEIPLGRGSLLGCDDKRISRKHCSLRVSTDGTITLVSLHTNPCFYKAQDLDSFAVLLKGQSKTLYAGDEFALLPNSFQYLVSVKPEIGDVQSVSLLEDACAKINENGENKLHTALKLEQETSQRQGIQTIVQGTENSMLESDPPTPSKRKRVLPDWLTNLSRDETIKSTVKRATPTTSASATGYKKEVLTDEPNGKKIKSEVEEELMDVTTNFETDVHDHTCAQPIPEDSDSHQLCDDKKIIKPSYDTNKEGYEAEYGEISSAAPNMDTNHNTAGTSGQPISGDGDQQQLACDKNDIKASVDLNKAGCEAQNTETSPASTTASNSGTHQNPTAVTPIREPCIYAGTCYRKNPQHRADFSHPGDTDFLINEDLPECPYGTSCYRKNIQHRKDYKHTQQPNVPPVYSPSQSCGDSPQTNTKKRTQDKKRGKQSEDNLLEEDDYDYDDPFLNDDSSDDYEPTSSEDSDLDEEEDEDEESQERRRMLKEAKKFTRKNKKKKNV